MHVMAAGLDDDAWDDLLSYIEEKRVIPILGPELLEVQTETGARKLYEWLAEKLAGKLGVDISELPQPYTLNDVVSWYMASRGRREEAYVRLRGILRDATFAPPPALTQLAEIRGFDLFVTTTCDSLLEQALNAVRGEGVTEVLSYAPNRVVDLSRDRGPDAKDPRPTVFHLFGKVASSPSYVISDEDTLEVLCALQSEHLTPERLFHELETNHLLFIGSNFSNWLARLFLRLAKRRRLSDPRDVGEVLADSHSARDERLMRFLQQVSVRTRVVDGAEAFVAELYRRWTARHPSSPAAASDPQRVAPPAREMPDRAVFISYAREDLSAVQRIKAALDAHGVITWFDMERLEAGDDFDLKIRRNIQRCSFFIPVISANTDRRHEAYFRREWSYAIDRTRNMADGARFVLPAVVDGTNPGTALVPDAFKALHFTPMPDGEPPADFAGRLAQALGAV